MLLLLLACSDPPKKGVPPVVVDSDSTPVESTPPVDTGPPDGTFTGTLTSTDGAYTATFSAWHAFTWSDGDASLVYLAANPDASCDALVGSLLNAADPSPLFRQDDCNVVIQVGGALPQDFVIGDGFSSSIQLFCTFGGSGFEEYSGAWRWNGDWYVGTAMTGNFHLESGATGVTGTLEVLTVDGSFPYLTDTPAASFSGNLSGNVLGESCEGLANHPLFSR